MSGCLLQTAGFYAPGMSSDKEHKEHKVESKFLDKLLVKFEDAVLNINAFLFVLIIGIIFLQVVARRVGISLSGTEELARYSYVIFAFLAWPIAALKGSDIAITFIFDRLPRSLRKYGLVVFHTAMAAFACIAVYSLILNTRNARGVTAVSNQWLPLSVIFSIVTFGLVVTALFNLVGLTNSIPVRMFMLPR